MHDKVKKWLGVECIQLSLILTYPYTIYIYSLFYYMSHMSSPLFNFLPNSLHISPPPSPPHSPSLPPLSSPQSPLL